jgi:hypothetical protein
MSPLAIDYQPALVEAAVLAAVRVRGQAGALAGERDPLYEIADREERDAAFLRLHARWFERLALHRPLEQALAERPAIGAGCARCLVAAAADRRGEAADLLGAPPASPTLVVRVTADTLGAGAPPLLFLRRELLHVADMLDPAFGHPAATGGRGLESPVRDRYRVLWNTAVDGRLAAAGLAPATARADRRRELGRAFPELGAAAEAAFERFWGAGQLTHAALLAFARGADGARRLCPLCGLPTGGAEPVSLAPPALAAAAADFPAWDPRGGGVCPRCAEIYALAARGRPA